MEWLIAAPLAELPVFGSVGAALLAILLAALGGWRAARTLNY